MCGIAGVISANGKASGSMEQMVAAINHRGPEGEGFYRDPSGQALFGHKRLCIIDLSPAAAQPFRYQDRYQIIHNGELYNYLELREILRAKGYAFRSDSDTEVIVAAYAEYGERCLEQFNGMFAFAIWDEAMQTLFAARDRMGEKPFFYYYQDANFVFASEIKSLWEWGVPKRVSSSMVYNFLTIDLTSNPVDPSETFFEDIHKLPAASFLQYAVREKQLVISKYWQPELNENNDISDDQAISEFKHLFSESIRLRMRSDVAIGTSLSGGLDSSAVIAFSDAVAGERYTHKAFTGGFPGYEKDETAFASLVSNEFGVEQFRTSIDPSEVVSLMNRVMHFQEEPVLSGSPLLQYRVYEEAKKQGVTVLLDGQGADEMLAGYQKYYKWYWQQLYREKRLGSTGELRAARSLGNKEGFGWKNKITALFPELVASLQQGKKSRSASRSPFISEDLRSAVKQKLHYLLPPDLSLNGQLYFNSFVYGLEELLRMADRNSMAHATEVRLPFLDHRLVEFVFTLPAQFKIREGWSKWLLRKAVDKKLPDAITWRKDKVGFEPPQKLWMHQPMVKDAIQEGKKILVQNGILAKHNLKKEIRAHDAHAANNLDWKCWSASYLYK
jgi:asparagine synthase (glutamine-hydrolysing)